MNVKEIRELLSQYRDDEAVAIQIHETGTGEYVDFTYDVGISEEDSFGPVFTVDVEADKFRKYMK